MKRALVTGAAGLFGSHVVDLLVREGWQVRALDNLEPQTHRRAKPAWINPKDEFIEGDMRNRDAITAALDGIEVVFHQAAYSEGTGECPKHGLIFPSFRRIEQVRRGEWQVQCSICGAITKSVPTPE